MAAEPERQDRTGTNSRTEGKDIWRLRACSRPRAAAIQARLT
jgi:hypothetical protein